ncbi:recQ-mediated genome instability protein 1 [Diabrotica virgifera virgifera]|uniref:RecQ-mediated genome instability protein 1 n=1 Tax=Diabrotica virgifera virgifera TaxID=50390 RepID=A0A6P7GM74_DIAVI|nr:recQ-mediated genome instability protein 1 [Diabrotica virgifera virgifera]
MEELLNVESFFKASQVHLSREWLESCIQWCKEENLPPNYTLKDLQMNVFEQWLLLDLRDVEIPCLPPDLASKLKYILQGKYSLQLMQVVDISKPKYFQLQRIRNGIPKNLEQESENSKRVLQLTLTDGVQEVIAVEYKPVECLNLNLSPGIKIRLMGPIEVRRGRLMLEDRHVKIIGGEVDTLLVSNAAENILAKSLNQPLNEHPQIIKESILTADTNIFNETDFTSTTQNRTTQNNVINNTVLQNQRINNQFDSNRNLNTHLSSTPKPNTAPPQFQNVDDFDDDFQIDTEIEMLMEAERDFEDVSITEKSKSKTPDLFEDDLDFDTIDIPSTLKPSTSKNVVSNLSHSKSIINISDIIDEKTISVSTTQQFDKIGTPTASATAPVVWSVEKLVKTIPNVSNGKFKIRAKFKKITEKMTVVEDNFHLVAEVEDEGAAVALKFHSDVVSDLIGCSVQEFMGLREEWLRSNVEAKNKVLGALDSLKNRLTDLDNVLEVVVNVKEKFPVLVKIL